MLANCLADLTAIGPGGVPAVALALFLAGLAGGATHCSGMCAPFVLAQAGARADRSAGGGMLARLSGAALLPYHLGRMLGYALLGAVAGAGAGLVTQLSGMRWLLALLLLGAAVLMALQASERLPERFRPHGRLAIPALPGLSARLGGLVAPLLAAPTGLRGVGLGLALSALPCGMLYAALAGAAATGSALAGAIAMAAFVLGTVPALVGVALLGRLFLRRAGAGLQLAGAVLFALNAVVLAGMAWRLVA
ncbi:sulfite exporter TauE/SafE family protein [Falsiroseomonas bella]|uniref:Sulfite exporter TauE/SafE family protein n=1 Tax=Falsiroseomonas bella TaxID=2184016 RepID=A0A317FHX0_9PROT|nr:sulfite exporter TauE/SafE family protein [Falsiroseomonas bella]PWS37238.1 sulfite exporter TauE/SafE family protein [Falsiroseomonas bella]